MLNEEHLILGVFIHQPWKKYTLKEVMKMSGKKSEGYVYNTLKSFVSQNILSAEKIGNSIIYSLNHKSGKSQIYAGFAAEHIGWSKKNIPYGDLERIASLIPTEFYCFLITGSYANGKQRKDSDIDVVILCDDAFDPKKVYSELKHECEMNIPQIHLYVFRKKEFLEMLSSKKANYGKETARNFLLLFGGRQYYSILSKAINSGFNG